MRRKTNVARLRVEALERRELLAGVIGGLTFNDLNQNGIYETQAGETPLAERTVYLDVNRNHYLDAAEPSRLTGADGRYEFAGLAAGSYAVGQQDSLAYAPTTPALPAAGSKIVDLQMGSLTYDPVRDKLYAVIPATSPAYRNSVAVLDPATGEVTAAIAVGSNPGPLALADNGEVLYVATGYGKAVQRVNLLSLTAGESFTLGNDRSVEDMKVVPGTTDRLAISWRAESGPNVAIFENGLPLPKMVRTGNLHFADDGSVLYGISRDGFVTLKVDGEGLSLTSRLTSVASDFARDFDVAEGRVYLPSGWVFDGASGGVIASLPGKPTAVVAPIALDAAEGLVFVARYERTSNRKQVDAYDIHTYRLAATFQVPDMPGETTQLIRLASGKLALNLNCGQMVLIDWQPRTSNHDVLVADGQVASLDLGSKPIAAAGAIRGQAYYDGDQNGSLSAGEPGLFGRTVFLDDNANGTLDAGERSTLTDAAGKYAFDNLPPRSYTVAEVGQADWRMISPSPQEYRVRRLPIAASKLLFDSARGKIYAAVGSDDARVGNCVVIIDPETGAIERAIEVGSQPNNLAISRDGKALYVSFGGVNRISRINLATGTVDLDFSLGSDPFDGPNFVRDMEVLGEGSGTLAVWRSDRRLAIYDDGVARPQVLNYMAGIDGLTSSPTTLYGTVYGRLLRFSVTSSGATIASMGPPSSLSWDILYDEGRILSAGKVFDPQTGLQTGEFEGNPLAVDRTNGLSFSVGESGVGAFDLTSLQLVKSLADEKFQGGNNEIFVGSNRLAFLDGKHVFLLDWNARQASAVREHTVDVAAGQAIGGVDFGSVYLQASSPPATLPDNYRFADASGLTVSAPGVLVNDSSGNGTILTAVLVTGPTKGSIALQADGSFTYTPGASFGGTDTFTYRAFDGHAFSQPQQVSMLEAPPGAPAALNDTYSFVEDTPGTRAAPGVLANDTSASAKPLSAELITGVSHGELTLRADGGFDYAPAKNFAGQDQFMYRAFDADGASRVSTVTLNVMNINDTPLAVDDSFTTAQNTALVVAARGVLINDVDPDNQPLSAKLESGPQHGTVTLGSNGSFSYFPDTDYRGADSFTYRTRDFPTNWSEPATVALGVTPVADTPTAQHDAYVTPEDTALTSEAPGVLANDSDPQALPLSAVLATGPKNGTLSLAANGRFTYTPRRNFAGTDQFVYRATSASGNSGLATATIQVTPVNDPPVVFDGEFRGLEGQLLSVAAPGVLQYATDADQDPLAAVWLDGPAHGTLTLNSDGSFTYLPDSGYWGPDSFRYHTSDGTVQSRIVNVELDVQSLELNPVARDDTFTFVEDYIPDGPAFVVTYNDSGRFGMGFVQAILVSGPAHGKLTLSDKGLLTYEPDRNYTGTDTFTYRCSDGLAISNVATVTLQIVPINDLPVARPDEYTATEGTPLVIDAAGLLANDTDIDTSALTTSLVRGPDHGRLELQPDGSFRYTAAEGFSGVDTFEYGVHDRDIKTGVKYALASGPDSYSTNLYEINLVTGEAHFVTTLSLGGGQLEFLPDGRLLALTSNNLLEIDTATWNVVRIDKYSNPSVAGGGLVYNPADGKLYSVASASDYSLITVDPSTGKRTVVASLGDWHIGSLAFADDGILYGVNFRQDLPDRLVRINIVTGEVTLIGPLGRNNGGPLEWDPDTHTLYMTGDSLLFSINRESGAATPIRPPGGASYQVNWPMSLVIPQVGPQATATVSIEVASSRPWHNSTTPCDVDGDKEIAPGDALAVIDFINALGSGPVGAGASMERYYDVNGDNFVSPVDALSVINYLNAYSPNAAAHSPSGDVEPLALATAAAFAEGEGPSPWMMVDDLLTPAGASTKKKWIV